MGQKDALLRVELSVTDEFQEGTWDRAPLSLSFTINNYTSSGIKATYFKVIEKSGYNTKKFIRYKTEVKKDYICRI